MPESIRVAVASNSAELLNGHFGSCIRFLVYQLSRNAHRLIDIRSTIEADSSDDRNQFRANLIKDCHVLFVQSIGGPALPQPKSYAPMFIRSKSRKLSTLLKN